MMLPTESQWVRYSALRAHLESLPAAGREAALQALRATGAEDPQVLSLLAVHWALPPDLTHDRSGERIGNFTLEERLGAGGMGVVYRAQQHLGPVTRPVAVKLIHPALLETAREEALARFLAELQTLVTLQHEGIARIYDGGIAEAPHTYAPLPYIAMELVHGGLQITTYARDYALSWQERLAVFVRVCHTVRYAHERRVIHRDLKPANILVDPDGRPVVIDFGLAQACDAMLPGAHLAASGTPAYMSPEQVSDAFGAVSDKSDVYALGLILYELLTEQHPYVLPRDGSFEEGCQVIVEATPPPLWQYNAAYEGELEAIMAAALAKRSVDRISVAVLRSRLERYLHTLPLERDRLLHDTSKAPRDLQTVPSQGSHHIAPIDVQPWAERAVSSSTAPERRRPPAPYDLDQADTGSPPPSAQPPAPDTARGPAARHDRPDAERRQLTVLFCDLVGSTALSGQLDPEDLREVIQAYLETCTEVVARFGGNIEKFLGDGALVCFGYPQAHEDDPQRAVRAGLGIVEAIARLNMRLAQTWGIELAVRLGIHTGLVVAGELRVGETREPQAIVGETPNIAARLQALAAPNTVVCSSATARLVDGYFTLEPLGPQVLKGVATPLPVYRVMGEGAAQTRLDVAATRGLTPLVGREPEVALLLERWAAAKDSRGQVVLLNGEAGIGKSRLVQAFTAQLTGEAYTRIVYHCSPYYQQSAFYPVVDHLQRLLQFHTDETPEERLRKLETVLRSYDFALEDVVPLMAALLLLPPPERYSPLTLTPQHQKQKTLETLLAWLLKEAEWQPVCVVMEDLHWGDPSTLEWLSLLIDQLPTVRMLLLLLFRPECQLPWAGRSYITPFALSRLSTRQTEGMIGHVTGGKRLPAAVVQHLVATTDGVPLFIEELTKMVLESGLVTEREGQYELVGSLPLLAIPTTLHDSLMARLDRLGAVKQVAQLGAMLGREFSYELLQAVLPLEETALQHGLSQLVAAELLYQRGLPPQARYRFKHALIQETAYHSMLHSTRRHHHGRIAQVLEARFPDTCARHPELVAHHYTEAGLNEQAIPYWQRAGQRAVERSANVEAIAYLTKGLALLEMLPDTSECIQPELALQTAMGLALIATKGYAAPDVEKTYARARQLGQQIGDITQLFPVLRGLWIFYVVRGELQAARELGEQILTLAQRQRDPALLVEAHRVLGTTVFYLGELAQAREHLEQGIALYDRRQHRSLAFLYGQDPAVTCLSYAAWALWLLGYPDQALKKVQEALALAQELSHPFTRVYALVFAAGLHGYRREAQVAQERTEAAITLAAQQGFTFWVAMATIRRGGALAEQGQPEEGTAQIRQGQAAYQATGAELSRPANLAMLAEAYAQGGQAEEGLSVLTEALAAAHRTGERYYEAELYRLRGELLLALFSERQAEAEACFRQAIDIARHQQAKSWELRAAMSLSHLFRRQGKRKEARHMLSEVYGWFTEGFATADLQEAEALLQEVA